MDLGLVICRFGDALEIGDGLVVTGDGASHHEVVFRLVIFRPFVDEVCIGSVVESNEDGVRISLGYFENIIVPAYWMLRPSEFDASTGLWVWTPDYGEEEEEDGENDEDTASKKVKQENGDNDNASQNGGNSHNETGSNSQNNGEDNPKNENRFEMDLGSEIRFKVKAINFTQVTNTAKGVQATTTSTSLDRASKMNNGGSKDHGNMRKRSSSVDVSDDAKMPASMQIVASICDDGLGLTSWWAAADDEEEEEGGDEEEAEGEYDESEQNEDNMVL